MAAGERDRQMDRLVSILGSEAIREASPARTICCLQSIVCLEAMLLDKYKHWDYQEAGEFLPSFIVSMIRHSIYLFIFIYFLNAFLCL